MERFIEEIDQLMKPYYEYTEKNKIKNNSIVNKISKIRKEIADLENNPECKQQKDLKNAELRSLMIEFDKNIKYRKVYVKEMIEIKNNIINRLQNKKNIILEFQNNLKKQLQEKIKSLEEIEKKYIYGMQKLESELHELNEKVNSFKYEYDENNRSINDFELEELFNKTSIVLEKIENMKNSKQVNTNQITVEITELNKKINSLEEKIKIINIKESEVALTKEELKISNITLSKLEQEEYDTRKGIKKVDEEDFYIEEGIPVIEEYNIPSGTIYEPVKFTNSSVDIVSKNINDNLNEQKEDISYDLGDSIDFKVSIRGNNTIVKTEKELCNQIYQDIMEDSEDMNSIKIDNKTNLSTKSNSYNLNKTLKNKVNNIFLEGEYLNVKDLEVLLDKFYIREKDRNYCLNDKIYKLSYNKFKKLRNELSNCIMIAFIKYKQHKKNDEYSLYGKTASDKNLLYKGEVNINTKEGFYVYKADFIKILSKILKEDKKLRNVDKNIKFKSR